jgi:hypothetical protein
MLQSHGDIGLLKLRRDGFGYLAVRDPATAQPRETFGSGTGSLVTVPFRIEGSPARVYATAETAPGGTLRFEVLNAGGVPVRGYTLDDAIPLGKSGLRQAVHWKGREALEPGVYRMRVRIDRTSSYSPRLYGFYVTSATK